MSGQGPPPWDPDAQPPVHYPRQQLLPQEVKPGRNRKPLFIGIAAALVLVIGAAVAYVVLRDDGEDTRAAYCAALRELTQNGDLESAVSGADASTLKDVQTVRDLAPNAVADDWDTLSDVATQAQSGTPDYSQFLNAFNALRVISKDAENNCDLSLDIPMM